MAEWLPQHAVPSGTCSAVLRPQLCSGVGRFAYGQLFASVFQRAVTGMVVAKLLVGTQSEKEKKKPTTCVTHLSLLFASCTGGRVLSPCIPLQ